jgi:putative membrane protein
MLVPASVKKSRAHRRAVEQFLAQNMHTTQGRTGVLIFVSVAERYAEILADSGINALVPKSEWQAIVDDLTRQIGGGRAADGFVSAVTAVGKHLAKHFPPGSADRNELPDHLIILA